MEDFKMKVFVLASVDKNISQAVCDLIVENSDGLAHVVREADSHKIYKKAKSKGCAIVNNPKMASRKYRRSLYRKLKEIDGEIEVIVIVCTPLIYRFIGSYSKLEIPREEVDCDKFDSINGSEWYSDDFDIENVQSKDDLKGITPLRVLFNETKTNTEEVMSHIDNLLGHDNIRTMPVMRAIAVFSHIGKLSPILNGETGYANIGAMYYLAYLSNKHYKLDEKYGFTNFEKSQLEVIFQYENMLKGLSNKNIKNNKLSRLTPTFDIMAAIEKEVGNESL